MRSLKQILSEKTNTELLFYINNVDKHTEEAVRLAQIELQNRNFELPADVPEKIEEQLKAKAIRDKDTNKNPMTKNVVEDPDAPLYYSQRAIYIFSILFSVLFGSFLLAANCKDAGRKSWIVILFGFVYSAITLIILDQFQANLINSYIANCLGVVIMYELFWKRYIGKDTLYRARPIWKPLVIAFIIFIPILLFVVTHTR